MTVAEGVFVLDARWGSTPSILRASYGSKLTALRFDSVVAIS